MKTRRWCNASLIRLLTPAATFRFLAVMGVAALLSACIPSLNPFFTEKDVVFEPRLLGEWQSKDKTNTLGAWKFEREGTNGYCLTIKDDDSKTGLFHAQLFKIGQEQFLDVTPSKCDYATNQTDLVAFAMFPGHLLARVSQMEPELKIAFFDFDWLMKQLEKAPGSLAHHKEGDGRIILTAATAELQQFVSRNIANLFKGGTGFARLTNAPAGEP